VVQQWNQSDLAFLRERARRIQAELWFANDTLHFATRGNRTGTTLSLVLGTDLLEAQLRADLAHQRTAVHVSGFDASQRESIDESAGADAIQAETSGGRTGIAVLQQAFGERVSYRVRSDVLAADDARDWAKAEMLRRARSFVTVNGMTSGTADMIVGSTVSLDAVGGPFNGDGYYVTRVCHTYDLVDGFRTHFDAERPTVNEGA
jgi:phage protein D